MRRSGCGCPEAMYCASDQILRLAPSIIPDIEPVVSSANTTSTRGGALGICTAGGIGTLTTSGGSVVGSVFGVRSRGMAEAAHAARQRLPATSMYVMRERLMSMGESSVFPQSNAWARRKI